MELLTIFRCITLLPMDMHFLWQVCGEESGGFTANPCPEFHESGPTLMASVVWLPKFGFAKVLPPIDVSIRIYTLCRSSFLCFSFLSGFALFFNFSWRGFFTNGSKAAEKRSNCLKKRSLTQLKAGKLVHVVLNTSYLTFHFWDRLKQVMCIVSTKIVKKQLLLCLSSVLLVVWGCKYSVLCTTVFSYYVAVILDSTS